MQAMNRVMDMKMIIFATSAIGGERRAEECRMRIARMQRGKKNDRLDEMP